MIEYHSIDDIRDRAGMRIVLVQGMPSPWGQAAKTILEVKGIDYVAAPWLSFEENADIQAWGGEASAPIVAWNDEKPVHRWLDILNLAERVAPEPSLVPDDPNDRALMVGFSNEIAGEKGLGWNSRLMIVALLAEGEAAPPVTAFGRKYGYNAVDAAAAGRRIAGTLGALSAQLRRQRDRGTRFMVGDKLSALDIYWTAFANVLAPLPKEHLPIPEEARPMFTATDPVILDALDPLLLEHRLEIFSKCFRDPVEM